MITKTRTPTIIAIRLILDAFFVFSSVAERRALRSEFPTSRLSAFSFMESNVLWMESWQEAMLLFRFSDWSTTSLLRALVSPIRLSSLLSKDCFIPDSSTVMLASFSWDVERASRFYRRTPVKGSAPSFQNHPRWFFTDYPSQIQSAP